MIEALIGAAIGAPLGALAVWLSFPDTEHWRALFYEQVADWEEIAAERDQLRQRVKAMQTLYELGVRRHKAMEAHKQALKDARRAKRDARVK